MFIVANIEEGSDERVRAPSRWRENWKRESRLGSVWGSEWGRRGVDVVGAKQPPQTKKANQQNPDRSLTLSEFLELLLRVSMAKFSRPEPHAPAAAAFESFMAAYVTPLLSGRRLGVDPDVFRKQRLCVEANDVFLTRHLPLLKVSEGWG